MMYHVKIFFVFLLGFAIGVLLAVMLFLSSYVPSRRTEDTPKTGKIKPGIDFFLEDPNSVSLEDNILRLRTVGESFRRSNINKNQEQNKTELYDDFRVSDQPNLKSINVVCVIFSTDLSRSSAAADTWAKHCSSYHFYSKSNSDFNKYLNVTAIKAKNAWHYLCEVMRHIHSIYEDNFDWVMFIPDDVFVIVENLRHYVRYKNPHHPYYLGDISCFWFTYYNTAEAGFALSKGALKLLTMRFNSSAACEAGGRHWRNEDYHLGRHLSSEAVRPEDTRDRRGRGRFHAFTLEQLYVPDEAGLLSKYFTRRVHPYRQGPECCNRRTITFRASCQDRIHFYYYMLYRIKTQVSPENYPNNISNVFLDTPQVWQNFIFDELGRNTDLSTIDADEYYRLWAKKVPPDQLIDHIRDEYSTKRRKPSAMKVKKRAIWS